MGQFDLTRPHRVQGDVHRDRHRDARAVLAVARSAWLTSSRIYLPETFLAPQLVGGLVFGVGFAIAGLCPGTSCVAAATGRGDGLAVMLGMLRGVLLTGAVLPAMRGFFRARRAERSLCRSCSAYPRPSTVLGVSAALAASHSLWIERRLCERRASGRVGVSDMTIAHRVLAVAAACSPSCRGAADRRDRRHAESSMPRRWRATSSIRGRSRHRGGVGRVDSESQARPSRASTCAPIPSSPRFHVPTAERMPLAQLATMKPADGRDTGALLRGRRSTPRKPGCCSGARHSRKCLLLSRRSARLDGAMS